MSDKNIETDFEETPKKSFVQRVVDKARTPVGKTVLIGTGSIVALVATYFTGFRDGQDSAVLILEGDEYELREIEGLSEEETEDTQEDTTESDED